MKWLDDELREYLKLKIESRDGSTRVVKEGKRYEGKELKSQSLWLCKKFRCGVRRRSK